MTEEDEEPSNKNIDKYKEAIASEYPKDGKKEARLSINTPRQMNFNSQNKNQTSIPSDSPNARIKQD